MSLAAQVVMTLTKCEQDPEVEHANLPFVKKKVVGFVWRRSWASGTVAAVFHSVFDESFDLKNIYLEILSFSMFFVDFH